MDKVVLFGAGKIGAEALKYYGEHSVECFIDNNPQKQGGYYNGKKVIAFESYLKELRNFKVIITSRYVNELSKQLRDNGVVNFTYYSHVTEIIKGIILKELEKYDPTRLAVFGVDDYTEQLIKTIIEEKYNLVSILVPDNDKMIGKEICGYRLYGLSQVGKDIDCFLVSAEQLHSVYRIVLEKKFGAKKIIDPYKLRRFFDTSEIIYNPYLGKSENNAAFVPETMRTAVRKYVEKAIDISPLFETVEIETYNRCNGVCSFCPVNKNLDSRKEERMSPDLFKIIIRQLADMNYNGRLALFSNNEPFLDERILEFHKYARENLPKVKMHLFTNGTLLTIEKFIELMKYIDELIIDNYHQDLKLIKPCKDIKEYVENHPDLKDKVTISMRKPNEVLTSRGGEAPNKKGVSLYGGDTCALPFEQFIIRPDGKVSLCCNDPLGKMTLGDLNEESIIDIWYGEKYKAIRRELAVGRKKVKHCTFCDTFYLY